MPRVQMTYTFNRKDAADAFELWLRTNEGAAASGGPVFVDLRQVDATKWVVEFSTTFQFRPAVQGFADGCEFTANKIWKEGETKFKADCERACRVQLSMLGIAPPKQDELVNKLKHDSDLFCYVMHQCNPVDRKGFNQAVLETLVHLMT